MSRAGRIDCLWDYGGVHHGYHRERTEERIAGVSRGRGSLSDNVTGFITTPYHRARSGGNEFYNSDQQRGALVLLCLVAISFLCDMHLYP